MSVDYWQRISEILIKIVENKTLPQSDWKSAIQYCCRYIRMDDQYPLSITKNISSFTETLISAWESKLRNAHYDRLVVYSDIFWQFYLFCRQLCDLFYVNIAHVNRLKEEFDDRYDEFAIDRVLLLQWRSLVICKHVETLVPEVLSEIEKGFDNQPFNMHVGIFLFSLIAVDNNIDFAKHVSYGEMVNLKEMSLIQIYKKVKMELNINNAADKDDFEESPIEFTYIFTETYKQVFAAPFQLFLPAMTERLVKRLPEGSHALPINMIDELLVINDELYEILIHGDHTLKNFMYDQLFFKHKLHFQDSFIENVSNADYVAASQILALFEKNPDVLVEMATVIRGNIRTTLECALATIPTTISPGEAACRFAEIMEEKYLFFTTAVIPKLRGSNAILSSLNNAMGDIVNDYGKAVGPLTCPFDAICLHVHNLLLSHFTNTNTFASPLSETLLMLICVVRNHSAFFEKYKLYLIKRLDRHGFKVFNSLETDTLNRIKVLCGNLSLLQIKDILNSVLFPNREGFLNWLNWDWSHLSPSVFDMSQMPVSDEISVPEIKLPAELSVYIRLFTDYYSQLHQSVHIEFQLNYGTVELEVYSENGHVCPIVVNVTQATILFLMGEQMPLDDLALMTGLSKTVLRRFFSPLVDAGILSELGSKLVLNSFFPEWDLPEDLRPSEVMTNPLLEEIREPDPNENKWRMWRLVTFICRYMKQNSPVKHADLLNAANDSQTNLLPLSYEDFKEAIEHLLSRDIIGRVSDDCYLYNP